jgi:hypothetical protein
MDEAFSLLAKTGLAEVARKQTTQPIVPGRRRRSVFMIRDDMTTGSIF